MADCQIQCRIKEIGYLLTSDWFRKNTMIVYQKSLILIVHTSFFTYTTFENSQH